MLFNKVHGENEKCVLYFYLKTESTFWPTQYLCCIYLCMYVFTYFKISIQEPIIEHKTTESEERISDLEDKIVEITTAEQNKDKKT